MYAIRSYYAVLRHRIVTNFNADAPSGPQLIVGGPVRWTYAVTNTGQTDLTDVTVTDDNRIPPYNVCYTKLLRGVAAGVRVSARVPGVVAGRAGVVTGAAGAQLHPP